MSPNPKKVVLVSVRHRKSLSALKKLALGCPQGSLFLLEAEEKKKGSKDEFILFSEYLKEKALDFRFIDTAGLAYYNRYIKKASIFEMIRLCLFPKALKDTLFEKHIIKDREKVMKRNILHHLSKGYKIYYIVVGKDHIENIKKMLENVETSVKSV